MAPKWCYNETSKKIVGIKFFLKIKSKIMWYEILAVITAFLHTLVVLAIFSGAILSSLGKLKSWVLAERVYFVIAISMIVSFIFTGTCYLTIIEQWLWGKANSPYSYSGGCISHYLSFAGIKVADKTIFWTLVASLILGLGSSIVFKALSFFNKK
jgi:hypothetical protein